MEKHFRLSSQPSLGIVYSLLARPQSEWKMIADKELASFYITKHFCSLLTELTKILFDLNSWFISVEFAATQKGKSSPC